MPLLFFGWFARAVIKISQPPRVNFPTALPFILSYSHFRTRRKSAVLEAKRSVPLPGRLGQMERVAQPAILFTSSLLQTSLLSTVQESFYRVFGSGWVS